MVDNSRRMLGRWLTTIGLGPPQILT